MSLGAPYGWLGRAGYCPGRSRNQAVLLKSNFYYCEEDEHRNLAALRELQVPQLGAHSSPGAKKLSGNNGKTDKTCPRFGWAGV